MVLLLKPCQHSTSSLRFADHLVTRFRLRFRAEFQKALMCVQLSTPRCKYTKIFKKTTVNINFSDFLRPPNGPVFRQRFFREEPFFGAGLCVRSN